MINLITVENFKCFSLPTRVEMSNLTACVGMNSVGKSSLIQMLLLLRQTYDVINKYRDTLKAEFTINLNDKYALQLGDSSQIMSSKGANKINVKFADYNFEYQTVEDDMLSLLLKTDIRAQELESLKSIFSPCFYYLNAERVGPRNYQNIETLDQMHCGFHGEYSFHVMNKRAGNKVSELRLCPYGDGKINTFIKQVEYWMDYIIPGINIQAIPADRSLRLIQLKMQQPSLDTGFISPNNFGFGISYVLPIIVTGLMAEPDTMIIIENPEAHLHPSGQSRVGRFLGLLAQDNIQVVIETHSEHVVNGIRLACLQNNIPPQNLCINYFSLDNSATTKIKRVNLNEGMDLIEWPEGFFDQEGNDLKELRYLRRSQKK